MGPLTNLTFSTALVYLKEGRKAARASWNGPNQWVSLQKPDEYSKMRKNYLYIMPTDGLEVPWVASQSDILAEDWFIVE